MPFAKTAPLREEIEKRVPQRPFTVEFWDGTSLPRTEGDSGPTFFVRSPRAAAHVLRAPGQLGLGRAYVSGDLDVEGDLTDGLRCVHALGPRPGLRPFGLAGTGLAAVRAAVTRTTGVFIVGFTPESASPS